MTSPLTDTPSWSLVLKLSQEVMEGYGILKGSPLYHGSTLGAVRAAVQAGYHAGAAAVPRGEVTDAEGGPLELAATISIIGDRLRAAESALAEAKREGAREALTRLAEKALSDMRCTNERVEAFRDREYPAPTPASVGRKHEGDFFGVPLYSDPACPTDRVVFEYNGEVVASALIHPDSEVLRRNVWHLVPRPTDHTVTP